MDNINLIRVGFSIEDFRLTDTAGDSGSPADRSGEYYSCLFFANADADSAKLIDTLSLNMPQTKSGVTISLAVIVPDKVVTAAKFKDEFKIKARLFCDHDLRAGKMFSVVDSSKARPSFHVVAFVVSDEGAVIYRQASENGRFDTDAFFKSVKKLI